MVLRLGQKSVPPHIWLTSLKLGETKLQIPLVSQVIASSLLNGVKTSEYLATAMNSKLTIGHACLPSTKVGIGCNLNRLAVLTCSSKEIAVATRKEWPVFVMKLIVLEIPWSRCTWYSLATFWMILSNLHNQWGGLRRYNN